MEKKAKNRSSFPLHITVGAAPPANFDLTGELQLVKAAMLYADKVSLCSFSSSTLILTSQFRHLDNDDILEIFSETAENFGQNKTDITNLVKLYRQISRKRRKNREELLFLYRMNSKIKEAKKSFRETSEKILIDSNAIGLESALNSGIVDFKYFDLSSATLGEDYYNTIAETIISGDSYPLLDTFTANLIETAIKEGKLFPLGVSVSKAKQVGLSSGLFNRLPSFDSVSVDEIMDIRKELENPLIRFRSAIIKFSRDVENAPWQKGFSQEVEQVYLEEVEPAILDIEEAYKSSKLLFSLVEKASEKPLLLPSSSALGLLVSQASQLPDIVTQTMAVSAGAAVIGLGAFKEWREQQQDIQKNQLYFYYQTRNQLL